MSDNNEPFAPFRQLFEQFDAGGPSGAPPALGFPLSPFPMPGVGASGLSPEDSTKRTVRQLYAALSALSGAEGRESGTMVDAWQRYADLFDLDTSVSNAPAQVSAAAMTTYRVWFYSLAQILVESYTLRLVHDELVVDDHRRTTATQQWLWSLSQANREELLRRCTAVDDDLVDEMEAARTRRNELLYDFGSWGETDVQDSLTDAQRYLRVLTALDDLVTDGTGFSYFLQRADSASDDEEPEQTDEPAESDS